MYLLDTDHWTILQLKNGVEFERLETKMQSVGQRWCFTSIVTFHEVMSGWMKYLSRPKTQQSVIHGYERFEDLLAAFATSDLVSFSERASNEFVRLRSEGCRIGTMDLRIAAIALGGDMTVVSRNTVDFERVPGLKLEDWIS